MRGLFVGGDGDNVVDVDILGFVVFVYCQDAGVFKEFPLVAVGFVDVIVTGDGLN